LNGTNFGATFTASGHEGGAFHFESGQYVTAPVDVSPSVLPLLTFGAWVRPETVFNRGTVLSQDNAPFDRTIAMDDRGNGAPTSWAVFTGTGVFESGVAPSTGAWTFLAAVYNQPANTVTFYVDGQSFSSSTSLGAGSSALHIGVKPSFPLEFFTGSIDEVFVFDEAFTPSRIATLQTEGVLAAVPEPSSLALTGLGAAGLLARRRRRRRAGAAEPPAPGCPA
jgi:hypothetical protein